MHIPLSAYRRLLTTYLAPQRRRVVLLALLLFLSIILQLLNPQFLKIFIDAISSAGAQSLLLGVAILFIAVAVVQQLINVVATYFSELVGWTATNTLRSDLALHLLRLDLSFHKVHTPGELIERVDGDVTALANFFSQFVIKVLGSILLLIGILIVLWFEDWRVGLSMTVFALIIVATMNSLRSVAVKHWKAFRQVSADLFGFIEERLRGTEDIRSSGAQAYVLRRLYMYTRERLQVGRKARLISSLPWGVPIIFFAMGNILAFILAAILYSTGSMSLGTAFLIYYYSQLVVQPIMLISSQLDDFQKASAGIVRIQELFQVHSALVDGPGATFPEGALSVEFEHVDFGYGEESLVLQDLTFRLAPGEVLGLLGRTGSGKTTVTRLLFRLYDPAQGTIRLGNVDVRDAKIADLRRQIGIVTQDVQLFHATIRDNLTLFDPAIDDARILSVLDDLGLLPWYKTLADGLDTMLAANGGGLSAGEAQLLAFARVFLYNPGLVILDEASSRLDPATEHLIEQAVDKLLQGRTGIIIAHRLHTIQRADTVMILDGGEMCEYGARATLASTPDSRFATLLQTAHEEVLA